MNNRNLHSAGSDEDTIFQGIPGVCLASIWYLFFLKPVLTLRRLNLWCSNCTYTLCLYQIIPTEIHMPCDTSNLKLVLQCRNYLFPFFFFWICTATPTCGLPHMLCVCLLFQLFLFCVGCGYKIWLPEIETTVSQNRGMCFTSFMQI